MRFKVDWASLILGRKFTVFLTLYLRAISKYKPPGLVRGAYRGDFASRVWGLYLEGLIHGGAYFRSFMVFTVNIKHYLLNSGMPL